MDKFLQKLNGINIFENKKKIINNKGETEITNYDEYEVKRIIKKMHFNFYIINLIITKETIKYEYWSKIKYEELVNRLVKLKYSDSEEFAILRKSIGNPNGEEFIQYNNYVEECKTKAKEWIKERDKVCA